MSSASPIKLPEGVSVLDDVWVPVVEDVVSENVTLAFVGVDFDRVVLVFGILLIWLTELLAWSVLTELFKVKWIVDLFWAKNERFFGEWYLYFGICVFALNLTNLGGLFDLKISKVLSFEKVVIVMQVF